MTFAQRSLALSLLASFPRQSFGDTLLVGGCSSSSRSGLVRSMAALSTSIVASASVSVDASGGVDASSIPVDLTKAGKGRAAVKVRPLLRRWRCWRWWACACVCEIEISISQRLGHQLYLNTTVHQLGVISLHFFGVCMLCVLHAAQVALCQLSGGADKDANIAAAKEVKASQITCLLADACCYASVWTRF